MPDPKKEQIMPRINDPAGAVNEAAGAVRDKASEVSDTVRDIGNKVRDAATDTYGQVREQAAGYINQGKEAAEEWEKSLETYVQEKPLQAVLLAAGVGLLLGLLWKRS
jgi:ElaB/YqjD/DUF883 family membrane-anchored ribosome-binding protein